MSFLQTTPPAAANGPVAEMYRRQQAHWGYVPDYAKVFSHHPELMARWAGLLAEIKRPMDRRRFELATFAAAHTLRHSPCTLAHGRALREFFTDAQIVALAEDRLDGVLDAADQAIFRYARRVAHDASQVTADDIARLRDHGLDDGAIFGVAAAVAGRAFFTKLLDALGVVADSPLATLPIALRDALTVGRPIDGAPCDRLPEDPTGDRHDH